MNYLVDNFNCSIFTYNKLKHNGNTKKNKRFNTSHDANGIT